MIGYNDQCIKYHHIMHLYRYMTQNMRYTIWSRPRKACLLNVAWAIFDPSGIFKW